MRALRQSLYRIGFPLMRFYWRVTGAKRYGVKLMAFNDTGALLLVRHAYGNQAAWMLPGGAIDRGETAAQAAPRELMEETALVAHDLTLFGHYFTQAEGKQDNVALFTARVEGTPQIDAKELVEARYFPLDALPPETSPATLRRIADWQAGRQMSQRW